MTWVQLPVGQLSSGYYSWMGDCLRMGKPLGYIMKTKVNSAFHLSRLRLRSRLNQDPACLAGFKVGCIHLCRVAGNTA